MIMAMVMMMMFMMTLEILDDASDGDNHDDDGGDDDDDNGDDDDDDLNGGDKASASSSWEFGSPQSCQSATSHFTLITIDQSWLGYILYITIVDWNTYTVNIICTYFWKS